MASDPPRIADLKGQRTQADQLRKAYEAGEPYARLRVHEVMKDRAAKKLTAKDAQHVLAVEHGFSDWTELRKGLAEEDVRSPQYRPVFRLSTSGTDDAGMYEDLARQLQESYAAGDESAARRVQAQLPRVSNNFKDAPDEMSLLDAQVVVAREYGYASFPELVEDLALVRRELDRPTEPEEALAIQYIRDGNADALRELLKQNPRLVESPTRRR
jgi:exonuclease VII large subunit